MQSPVFNPFQILGVDNNTSVRDIKKQYLKLVKKLHPDKYRNKGQQAFENAQDQMSLITKAYQVLTDPNERTKYENSQNSSSKNFQDMRNNFKRFDRNNHTNNIPTKSSFGESDLKDFNANFEQNRRRDPNDRGYGDELGMAPRMTTGQATRGYQPSDIPIKAQPQQQGSSFDPKRFNKLFEETVSSDGPSNGIIEKPMDGNPSGFSLMGSTAFSEVSVFDGNMIVGSEVNDFSSFDSGGGVTYTDYKKGYSETSIIKEGGQYEDDGMSLEQKIQMRDAGLSGSENQSKMNQAEWQRQVDHKFEMEKQEALRRERDNQKKVVMKYHDQYQDYLPAPEPSHNTRPPIQNNYESRRPTYPTSPLNQPLPVMQQKPISASSQQSYQIPQNSRNQEINGKPVNPGFMRFMDDTQQYIAPSPVSPQQQFTQRAQYSPQQYSPQQQMNQQQYSQQQQQYSQQQQQPYSQQKQQYSQQQQYAPQQYSHQQYSQQPPQFVPQQKQFVPQQQSSDPNDRRSGRSYNEFMMDRMHNMK
jgi:curved DNA-binding protein CbpA